MWNACCLSGAGTIIPEGKNLKESDLESVVARMRMGRSRGGSHDHATQLSRC